MRSRKATLTLAVAVVATSTMATAGCASTGTNAQGSSATATRQADSATSTADRSAPSSSVGATTTPTESTRSSATSKRASTTATAQASKSRRGSGNVTSKSSDHPPSPSSSSAEAAPASAPPSTAPKTQDLVLNKLPGNSKASTCVTVGSQRDVTSGAIAMGNFQMARKSYKSQHGHSQQPTVNLYVIPKHRSMPGVRITMTPTTGKGKARTIKSKSVEQADVWKYYGIQLPVPSSGTWRLTVTSGADRGCFNVNFHG